jgi:hypothetical protein
MIPIMSLMSTATNLSTSYIQITGNCNFSLRLCIVRFSYRSLEAFVRFVCVFRSFAFGAYCKLIRSRICINFLETLEDYLIIIYSTGSCVKQELLSISERMSSPPVFSVAQSFVFCVVVLRSSFTFSHCLLLTASG